MGAQKSKEPTAAAKSKEHDLSKLPARVDTVKVSGLGRTHDDYIAKAAEGLFQATTVLDVLLEAKKARDYLDELAIFKSVDVNIDISKGAKATPNGFEIVFKGKELSRVVGGIGTEIGQNEGSLTMELSSPNICGRGERLTVQGSYSNVKTNDLSLKLWKPFFHTRFIDYRPEVSLTFFRHADRMTVSHYKNSNYGLLADFSFISHWPIELFHSFQYESAIREISVLGKTAPFFVREHCGPRVASLFRHIVSYDQRDNPVFPKQGLYVKTTNEISGFGGDIGYMMNTTQAELNIPLIGGAVAQICSRIGVIQQDKRYVDVPLSSLFVFGGPQTLRGFEYGGAGPQVDGCSAGAHSYWSTGLHLWAPLPFSGSLRGLSNNFRSHLFYNFGNFNSFSTENMRSAAGIGIAYKFANRARIELNYCIPIDKQRGDKVKQGFTFGIGYEFI